MSMKSDFSGYATKNDIRCSDGRIIRNGAFEDCDGSTVPLVFQHDHTSPSNLLGNVVLENRNDGVYCYGYFNDSEEAQNAKEAVRHGDINALSIYANHVKQTGNNVVHGSIKEVSLVLAGANPGAFIDNVTIAHGDSIDELEDEVIIYNGETIAHGDFAGDPSEVFDFGEVEHADESDDEPADDTDDDEPDVAAVVDSLTDEQKEVVYGLVGMALQSGSPEEEEEAEDSNTQKENKTTVEHSADEGDAMNIFDKNDSATLTADATISHEDQTAFLKAAETDASGSFKRFAIAHAQDYGIKNIDILFPDAKAVRNEPDLYKRDTEWVATVLSSTHHVPFSRIKTLWADITADEARAKGFTLNRDNNHRKMDEIIKVAKRQTTPTTIYKKQKLDRDDILDITDFQVVNWLMREMRIMLDEEIARAILIGDGREVSAEDHINTESIRPIVSDDDLYVIHSKGTAEETSMQLVDRIRLSKVGYMGSGELTAFMTPALHAQLMIQRDQMGHRLYDTDASLASELGVSRIIEVPIMENFKDTDGNLVQAILVNLRDYSCGTDRGGEITSFDDFDIDYNQQKYLMETRMSGALTKPKSAIVIEQAPKA